HFQLEHPASGRRTLNRSFYANPLNSTRSRQNARPGPLARFRLAASCHYPVPSPSVCRARAVLAERSDPSLCVARVARPGPRAAAAAPPGRLRFGCHPQPSTISSPLLKTPHFHLLASALLSRFAPQSTHAFMNAMPSRLTLFVSRFTNELSYRNLGAIGHE